MATFAPYTDPPDAAPRKSQSTSRPWFARDDSALSPSAAANTVSYQSGSSAAALYDDFGGAIESGRGGAGGFGGGDDGHAVGAWETRFGWRVDLEAAAAYVLGPISALLLLIFETTSDYVRYHAYQSALLSFALLALHMLLLLLRFPHWFQWLGLALDIGVLGHTALRAYRDADVLERYPLPWIGEMASRWVGEE